MAKRYAEGTPVTVQSSRSEIQSILAKHGCLSMAWAATPSSDTLEFILHGKHFRFVITQPTFEDIKAQYKADGRDWGRIRDWDVKVAAEWRRRWRANVLLLKAKLEFIDGGDTTLEREFMPYLVLQDGSTVGDLIDGGHLPLLMAKN
jgi:hypothetical protein